jgi:nucleotide-binding universal stress UspA family protein
MFETLLVPLDGSAFGEQALEPAEAIAERTGASIELLQVHVPNPYDMEDHGRWENFLRHEERLYLDRIADEVEARLQRPVSRTLLTGEVSEAICEHGARHSDALIVIATHGRTGLSRTWLGSVADGVVRRSTLPVLLVRAQETAKGIERARGDHALYHRILVPLDGSEFSEEILEHALTLGRISGAHIHIVSVLESAAAVDFSVPVPVPMPPMDPELAERARRYVDEVVQRLQPRYAPYRITGEFQQGERAATAVLHRTRTMGADLVALATHGRGASRFFVGSVADKVLRGSSADVLAIRPMRD